MLNCAYCCLPKLEERSEILRHEPKRKLLFPNGQKIVWSLVCWDCMHERNAWETQREKEIFEEKERRRRWHMDVAKRNDERRAQLEANKIEREGLRELREIERAAKRAQTEANQRERELAEIIKLEQRLDELRKKHLTK